MNLYIYSLKKHKLDRQAFLLTKKVMDEGTRRGKTLQGTVGGDFGQACLVGEFM